MQLGISHDAVYGIFNPYLGPFGEVVEILQHLAAKIWIGDGTFVLPRHKVEKMDVVEGRVIVVGHHPFGVHFPHWNLIQRN